MQKTFLSVLALTVSGLLPLSAAKADGLAGPFLAAQQAIYESDFKEAATHFSRALIQDPSNPYLLENALGAFVSLGDFERAIPIARKMQSDGIEGQTSHMVLTADQLKRESYGQAIEDLTAGRAIGPLVDGLIIAWSNVGLGKMSEALDGFDAVAKEPGLASFGLYHKALAFALVGDFESADKIFAGEAGAVLRASRMGILAHSQVLSQLDRNPDAIELLDAVFGEDLDPQTAAMRAQLDADETLEFTAVRSVTDGLAEVFFTVAEALALDADENYTLFYTRTALYLNPDHITALLLTAELLANLGRHELATDVYNQVPADNPAFHVAEMGRADALFDAGKSDTAIEVLRQLTKTHGDLPIVHIKLGDKLRQLELFEEATKAYDAGLALYAEPQANQWFVYYARGITHERSDNWQQAEADLRLALELQPGQPHVLNYLGYSFVEKNENLEEAMAMIEQAVVARPDDGYITDSLAWGLFRLGFYEDAVKPMERAAELLPVDPIVNDHLGDVYWAVGRQLEAQFQWRRALSFEPEDKDATRIRRKLEIGLDEVLLEEGADPITMVNDG